MKMARKNNAVVGSNMVDKSHEAYKNRPYVIV